MKEHLLDIIIIETNKDHFKIWDDYFSKSYKIKIFDSLKSIFENKNIFNNQTIFIMQLDPKNKTFNKIKKNNTIFIMDYDFKFNDTKSNKNYFLNKPVNLFKIEKIINEIKQNKKVQKEDIIKIKKHELLPIEKKLYSQDRREFIKLTEKEITILIELKPPNRGSKKHLLKKVWNYNSNIKTATVETHIHRLRKKLAQFSKSKLAIKYDQFEYYIT